MNAYERDFDETKYMSLLIKHDEQLDKYNEIWEKASKVIKKGTDSKSVYKDQNLKTKIKSYEGKINPNSHDNKVASLKNVKILNCS